MPIYTYGLLPLGRWPFTHMAGFHSGDGHLHLGQVYYREMANTNTQACSSWRLSCLGEITPEVEFQWWGDSLRQTLGDEKTRGGLLRTYGKMPMVPPPPEAQSSGGVF